MERLKSLLWPALIAGGCFGAFHGLLLISPLQQAIRSWGFEKQIEDLRGQISGWLSAAIGALVAGVKAWYAGTSSESKDDDIAVGNPQQIDAKPDSADYEQAFYKLRTVAKELIRKRDQLITNLQRQIAIQLERRAIMKFTLYCALAFATASCIATSLSLALGTVPAQSPLAHLFVMTGTFAGVSAAMAFGALVIRGRPHQMPVLMFGTAALFINTSALLITVPYTLHLMLAAPRVLNMPMVAWIALQRLLLQPLAAVIGSIVGTIVAQLFLGPNRVGAGALDAN